MRIIFIDFCHIWNNPGPVVVILENTSLHTLHVSLILLQVEHDGDLSEAVPVLTEALEALNSISHHDITIIRSLKNPPVLVKLVLEAVCVLMVRSVYSYEDTYIVSGAGK